jgi:hypothetical protein
VVPDVEPEIFSLDSLPRGVIEKIFIFFPGPHNFLGTTYFGDSIGTEVGVETEEVTEEMKMRLDIEWGSDDEVEFPNVGEAHGRNQMSKQQGQA